MSHRLPWALFDLVFGPFMARRLNVRITGFDQSLDPARPVLLLANHQSWWDGFLVRAVQRAICPAARFRAVMLEKELRAHPFLRLLGGMGIEPGSVASGRRLLKRLRSLTEDGAFHFVAFFPQGRIEPGDPRPLEFRPGVSAIARALEPVTVLPLGIRIVPGKTHKMDAFLSLGAPRILPESDTSEPELWESAVTEELDAISAFLRRTGEDASGQWPDLTDSLPRNTDSPWSLAHLGNRISRN